MSRPKTLLAMAGVHLPPGRLSESVVVVIDAQREYATGKLPLSGVSAALDAIAGLLARARAVSAPIIHIAHKGRSGGAFDPDSDGFLFAPQAAPIAGETVIEKILPNSFAGTTLDVAIGALGRKSLILAGFMTHMCVSSTARGALDLGYLATVLSDATATRDLPDPTDETSSFAADTIHRAALAELADRFAIIARVSDIKP